MMVTATLNGFIRKDLVSDGPVLIRINGQGDGPAPWEATPPVTIHDARPLQDAATNVAAFFAERNFVLLPHTSEVRNWDSGGSMPFAQNDIARIYMPEIEAIVRTRLLPGLSLEVDQGPYLVRRGPGTGNAYAQGVHQDYGLTPDDYQESLEAFSTPEFAAMWRARFDRPEVAGFIVINFWRTVYMSEPLRHLPLAVCDPASVAPGDIVPAALVDFAPSGKNTNQLALRYGPDQTWYYYSGMTTGEVLAFRVFHHFKDGRDPGFRTCFHSAFADPDMPADAPPRQSCEHRVGVFIMRD